MRRGSLCLPGVLFWLLAAASPVSAQAKPAPDPLAPLAWLVGDWEGTAGWRARETYTRTGPDRFTERFELAEPGKDFEQYSETSLRRRPRGMRVR